LKARTYDAPFSMAYILPEIPSFELTFVLGFAIRQLATLSLVMV